MPLYFFYTMVQKSQKWPKTQFKGSCLKLTKLKSTSTSDLFSMGHWYGQTSINRTLTYLRRTRQVWVRCCRCERFCVYSPTISDFSHHRPTHEGSLCLFGQRHSFLPSEYIVSRPDRLYCFSLRVQFKVFTLKHLAHCLGSESLVTCIFLSLVRPSLEYALPAWDSCSKHDAMSFERV